MLDAPKQSIDHMDIPDADIDLRARRRFPSRAASLDLCVASAAKNTYLTRYLGSVGYTLPAGWVHQSNVTQAMIHSVFEGRQVTLSRDIILIRSGLDNPRRRNRRSSGNLLHGTVTGMKNSRSPG